MYLAVNSIDIITQPSTILDLSTHSSYNPLISSTPALFNKRGSTYMMSTSATIIHLVKNWRRPLIHGWNAKLSQNINNNNNRTTLAIVGWEESSRAEISSSKQQANRWFMMLGTRLDELSTGQLGLQRAGSCSNYLQEALTWPRGKVWF